MPDPATASRSEFRITFFLAMCLCCLLFAVPSVARASNAASPGCVPGNEAAKPDTDKAKMMGTRPAEPPAVLEQLNSAIEQLTARISPAVVQDLDDLAPGRWMRIIAAKQCSSPASRRLAPE